MPDVFEVLAADHSDVRQMLADLERGPTRATGGTETELGGRKRLTQTLIISASRHEAVEEMYFWPVVRDRIPDGARLTEQAVSQEAAGKALLARLDRLFPSEIEFEEVLAAYIPAAREHIRFEEETVWPPLRQALTSADALDLGSKLADGKKTAPTRPHPHLPASPGALRAAGPAVAAADKLRDYSSGRDEHLPSN